MTASDFTSLPAECTVVVRPTATQAASVLATKYFPIKNGFDIDFVPLTKQALRNQQSGAGGGRVGFGDGMSAMPTMAITRRGESIGGPSMPALAQSSSVADAMHSASRTAAASIALDTLRRHQVKSQSAAEHMAARQTDPMFLAQYLVESEVSELAHLFRMIYANVISSAYATILFSFVYLSEGSLGGYAGQAARTEAQDPSADRRHAANRRRLLLLGPARGLGVWCYGHWWWWKLGVRGGY
jgi:hypothetical protein